MEEEELIQLTLTEDEALLLSSVTTLGIKVASGNFEGAAVTKALLLRALAAWPEAAVTLSGKMIILAETTKDLANKELENETKNETKMEGKRI